MKLLTRASVRHLSHHRAQLVLAVLGVALGVAVVLSIDLATRSANAAFRVSAEAVAGRATHEITSDVAPLDETLLARLRVELGVRAAAPVVEGYASSPRLPGRALRILGVDPFSEAPLRSFAVGGPGRGVASLVTTPHGILLSEETARRAGVGPGDSLPVSVAGLSWALPVVGTLEPADPLAVEGLDGVLVMDIAGAQDLLGLAGGLTRIDLRLPEGPAADRLLERVREALPPGATLAEAGTRTATMAAMTRAFEVNLTALSLLALLFGTFLIYNAVTFSVVQRRALLGRLRALGVTRGEILGIVLREAAVVGLAGAALGAAAGVLLARGLVRLVARTVNDLYFAVSVEGVALDPWLVAKAAALGLGATLLAALLPALEAAGTEPRLALLRSVSEEKARRLVPRAAALGALLLAAGTLVLGVAARSLLVSFAALFLVVLGMALLTPAGAVLLVRAAEPVMAALAGTLGRMASRGVLASLTRTAPAIAALVVAVSVTVGLGVMIQSFRSTLERWLDTTLQADLYVSLPGPLASRATGTLPPEVVTSFLSHPQVAGYTTYRAVDVVSPAGPYRLMAISLDPRGERAFDFLEGNRDAILRAFRAGEGVIVSEPYAFHRGLSAGDTAVVDTPAGRVGVPVLGVFHDYGSDQGTVMVARSRYDLWFDDAGVTSLGLFLEPGADPGRVADELLARVPGERTVVVRSNAALRAGSLEVFDRTFEVTAVLRMLAFGVAFAGVLSALMALELERARELGVLRAWGLEPGEVWKLVV
ncbi:MAG TPA: FtsX-like permease family protein, partial [Longimicrobiales bacterium]|nr:FtsX-like permease family protein [Longimicrobiales bacterium]